jgi:large subunit ribosomal protein L16
MLRTPRNTKYKYQYNSILPKKGLKSLNAPKDASILIKSKSSCLLTPQQLEVSRRILAKPVREEEGKLNIRFFPNLPLSKKPLQTRMGKGKGRPEKWVAGVRKGAPLFSISGSVPVDIIKSLYRRVNFRLPVYSKFMVVPKRITYKTHIKLKK